MSDVRTKLGELLRFERERRKIVLEEIAGQLKITPANLEAIERGDAASLPSEIYFDLFSKSYAEALGIDYPRTVRAIEESLYETADTVTPAPGAERKRSGKGRGKRDGIGEPSSDDASDRVLTKKFVTLFAAIVGVFALFLLVSKLFFAGNGSAEDAPAAGQHEPGISQAAEADVTSQAAFADYDWDVPARKKPDRLRLKLVTREQSWATVIADGDTALFQTLVPYRGYTVEADYRLIISIGVPSAVDIELNGHAVDITDPVTRRISSVEVNQVNLDSFLKRVPVARGPTDSVARTRQSREFGMEESTTVDAEAVPGQGVYPEAEPKPDSSTSTNSPDSGASRSDEP